MSHSIIEGLPPVPLAPSSGELLRELRELRQDVVVLHEIIRTLNDRIRSQGELLARLAERPQ